MTFLKRLRALTAVLGVAAATAAVATTLFGDFRDVPPPATKAASPRPDGGELAEKVAVSKFKELTALTYQIRNGDTLVQCDSCKRILFFEEETA